MSNNLEQFIREHREEFDSDLPSVQTWTSGRKTEQTPSPKFTGGRSSMVPFIWKVAAALILLAGSLWYFKLRPKPAQTILASPREQGSTSLKKTDSGGQALEISTTGGSSAGTQKQPSSSAKPAIEPAAQSDYQEEMYHYARLVEIKHRELKKIEADEPLLYQQFASDVNKLDSVYHALDHQLVKSPNREQLLEAMIQNLQLQMGLLNHQLEIVKQINHSKKSAYEKAFRSV